MEDRFRDGKLTKLSFAHTTFFQIRLTNVFREQLHSVFHFPNVQLLFQRCVYSSTSLLDSSAIQYFLRYNARITRDSHESHQIMAYAIGAVCKRTLTFSF